MPVMGKTWWLQRNNPLKLVTLVINHAKHRVQQWLLSDQLAPLAINPHLPRNQFSPSGQPMPNGQLEQPWHQRQRQLMQPGTVAVIPLVFYGVPAIAFSRKRRSQSQKRQRTRMVVRSCRSLWRRWTSRPRNQRQRNGCHQIQIWELKTHKWKGRGHTFSKSVRFTDRT